MKTKSDPAFRIIDKPVIEKIIETAFQLLQKPGLEIYNDNALKLLDDAGAEVDFQSRIVKLPRRLIENAITTTPHTFTLHNLKGEPEVFLEKNNFYPYPGTSAVNIYDYERKTFREARSKDLIDFIRVVEKLPYIRMNSSLDIKDVPETFTNIYRLALALKYSKKPIKASVLTIKSAIPVIKNLLFAVAGGKEEFEKKPFAFISVNPRPPLMWDDFTSQVLIECAKSNIPLSRGSAVVSGAGGPVTLIGSLIQQTAEALSGVTLSQIVQPGSPGLYGSAPIIFDVRKGVTPTGAIESLMFCCGAAQVANYLAIPTHLYTGISDSKVIDAQWGFESAMGILLGVLSGINLFPVGMVNMMLTQSIECVVIANELCGQVYRLMDGITSSDEDFTTELWEEVGHTQGFLSTLHTIAHFAKEQFNVSEIVDRSSGFEWQKKGAKDTAQRAHEMVKDLLAKDIPKVVDPKVEEEIDRIVVEHAKRLGIGRDQIPKEFFDN